MGMTANGVSVQSPCTPQSGLSSSSSPLYSYTNMSPSNKYSGFGSPSVMSPHAQCNNNNYYCTNNNNNNNSNYTFTSNNNNSSDWLSSLSSGWDAVTQKTAALAQTATEKVRGTDIDNVKSTLSKGWCTVSSTLTNYANELTNKVASVNNNNSSAFGANGQEDVLS